MIWLYETHLLPTIGPLHYHQQWRYYRRRRQSDATVLLCWHSFSRSVAVASWKLARTESVSNKSTKQVESTPIFHLNPEPVLLYTTNTPRGRLNIFKNYYYHYFWKYVKFFFSYFLIFFYFSGIRLVLLLQIFKKKCLVYHKRNKCSLTIQLGSFGILQRLKGCFWGITWDYLGLLQIAYWKIH